MWRLFVMPLALACWCKLALHYVDHYQSSEVRASVWWFLTAYLLTCWVAISMVPEPRTKDK